MYPKPSLSVYSANDAVVAAAGTAVTGPNLPTTKGVFVCAPVGNTGDIYIGGAGVTNSSGAQQGIRLVPGGMLPTLVEVANANLIYINADNNGDKCGFMAI